MNKNMSGIFRILTLVLLVPATSAPVLSQVRINELMSSNLTSLQDEDGDYPDWFELYNASTKPVELGGYGISDDPEEPFKWTFPQMTLSAGEHLLVFASGKDRAIDGGHLETVILQGDEWKYRIGNSEPPSAWKNVDFDDSQWLSGNSGIGYGDGDDETVIDRTLSLYMRRTFAINDVSSVLAAFLHIDVDDGFVAYLNGIEIARDNIGISGIPPAHDQTADSAIEPRLTSGQPLLSYYLDELSGLISSGVNVLAIQVHNANSSSSDLTCIPFLTLGLVSPPPNPRGVPAILQLQTNLHTNFKLSAEGEPLVLTSAEGEVIDSLTTTPMPSGISYGRQPDGNDNWVYFNSPTPGAANLTDGSGGLQTAPPVFSRSGGFYSQDFTLQLTSDAPSYRIHYTTDGSVPDETSPTYIRPFQVDMSENRVIRAQAFASDALPSKVITHTYVAARNITLPVVSISTDPANLWDEQTGIYVLGPNAEAQTPNFGANFWQDWERPAHIEFYEPNGSLGFSVEAGIKIFGGWSRSHPQKSLSVFARKEYGDSEIDYQIFPDLPIREFKSLVLRNSGNDWYYTLYRDAMIQALLVPTQIDIQAYRPAIILLNGEYWGVQNIREKINEDYLASHHGVDPDKIDELEGRWNVVEGRNTDFVEMMTFVEHNSLASESSFSEVTSQIDLDNYIDYMIAQIYCDNGDWPGNNLKYWRPQEEGSKWRWIIYDTDFGFGLYNEGAFSTNTLDFALETNGPDWPNPPWSTLLFRRMIENEVFVRAFVTRFTDHLNTIYRPSNVLNTIDSLKKALDPEMPRHFARWNGSMNTWENRIEVMRTFAIERPAYMWQFIAERFRLSGHFTLRITNSNPSTGRVKVNSLDIREPDWQGTYFHSLPIKVSAVPAPGYRFLSWAGDSESSERVLEIATTSDVTLSPLFDEVSANSNSVVINEINYNSAPEFDPGDWLELYNDSAENIELGGWRLLDSDSFFVFPDGTTLGKNDYVVICRDTADFKRHFPNVDNFLGNMNFGLNSEGETIRLVDPNDAIIDSLTYGTSSPWPVEPHGGGPTLVLIDPGSDNSRYQNWTTSTGHGTPGRVNDFAILDGSGQYVPAAFALRQNYPNPFNPGTTIQYSLPVASRVKLTIFNMVGEPVDTLVDEYQTAGVRYIPWNGHDQHGNQVATGLYIYRIETEKFKASRKLLLIR